MDKHRIKAKMRENEKGEMGVGTLIVFIAMIIVAAVAATVLITTAYRMQQQAEHTGKIAISDVATGFKVINMAGDRYDPGDNWNGNAEILEVIEVKVGLLAGSPDINVSDAIIEISDGTVDVTLSHVDTGQAAEYNATASATEFTVRPLRDMRPLNVTKTYARMTSGDVALIYIDANATGMRLWTQTTCSIKIIPKHGIPTFAKFTTPAVYTKRYVTL